MQSTICCAAAMLALAGAWPAQAQDSKSGAAVFARYCAACHGVQGRGDGPMRAVLTVHPTDLSLLAAQNGGHFPVARVAARIDGRDPLIAHGSEMPVYGDVFDTRDSAMTTERGETIVTGTRVADLVAYLRDLQRPAD